MFSKRNLLQPCHSLIRFSLAGLYFTFFIQLHAAAAPVTCTLDPGGLKHETFQQLYVNSDGSVTLEKPYFLFKNQQAPFLAIAAVVNGKTWTNDVVDLTGVCRFFGFSFVVPQSQRILAITSEQDAVRMVLDGSVGSIARYSHVYDPKGPVDFILTEITCRSSFF